MGIVFLYTVIIREAISEKQPLGKKLPKSDATVNEILEPEESTMLFDNQLTCSYSDLVEVAQAYRDYVTDNYKYNSGSRLITSYENAYLIFMEFANKPECVDSTVIDCELIEPGNLDFSDRQVRIIDYVTVIT